ncbi:IVNS1ABP [Symbiodinium pilosum]|uniref:IVNS1ABP protein n=1 Tax=Symbiodinium pilosum TaxID=2952 RepID=A0A812MGP3_SYMPI|nr:IVNS1ABP [Symbiodinium pilosum]
MGRRIGSTADLRAPLRRRRALPPFLYVEAISPFLRFDGLLPNMLYAFGGRNQEDGPLNTVEIFNTWHGCWVPGPPMPKRRAGSAAALLDDGRMMIIGGYDERGIAEGLLASCDIFDPVAGAWRKDGAAPLARARWGHGCASLQGKVYVVGGCSLQLDAPLQESFMETLRQCEIYLPTENRWIPAAPLQIARSGTRVVALGSRVLTAIGGCDDVFGRAETQPTVELYDVENQHWSVLQHRLSYPRRISFFHLSLRAVAASLWSS